MKSFEVIFTIICGLFVAWLVSDFVPTIGGTSGWITGWILYTFFPIFSVFCLFLAYYIGKRWLFVWQSAKFVLIGGFADIIDLKLFLLLMLIAPFSLTFKTISFLVAVVVKYIGNRYWTFHKTEKQSIKEASHFLLATLIGLGINVCTFYCATKIIGLELSVIFAALMASLWNFLSYKFIVFKK